MANLLKFTIEATYDLDHLIDGVQAMEDAVETMRQYGHSEITFVELSDAHTAPKKAQRKRA